MYPHEHVYSVVSEVIVKCLPQPPQATTIYRPDGRFSGSPTPPLTCFIWSRFSSCLFSVFTCFSSISVFSSVIIQCLISCLIPLEKSLLIIYALLKKEKRSRLLRAIHPIYRNRKAFHHPVFSSLFPDFHVPPTQRPFIWLRIAFKEEITLPAADFDRIAVAPLIVFP